MTNNEPQQGFFLVGMIYRCSSASTSFLLAALRVLHVDTSDAPAGIAWIEEQPPWPQHRR